MPYTPSLIQTILSVSELHRFMRLTPLADYTAGGDLHPAPKTKYAVVFVPYDTPCFHEMQQFSCVYQFAVNIYRNTINNC